MAINFGIELRPGYVQSFAVVGETVVTRLDVSDGEAWHAVPFDPPYKLLPDQLYALDISEGVAKTTIVCVAVDPENPKRCVETGEPERIPVLHLFAEPAADKTEQPDNVIPMKRPDNDTNR